MGPWLAEEIFFFKILLYFIRLSDHYLQSLKTSNDQIGAKYGTETALVSFVTYLTKTVFFVFLINVTIETVYMDVTYFVALIFFQGDQERDLCSRNS